MKKNNNIKILVGVATNGTGGVDSYILSFVKIAVKNNIICDVISTNYSSTFANKLLSHKARLIPVANLHNKNKLKNDILRLIKENTYCAAYLNISTAIMYPYAKFCFDNGIKNIIIHSHAHYNSQNNMLKEKLFDIAHYCYRHKLNKLYPKYAACSRESAIWIAGKKYIDKNHWTFVPNPIDIDACRYKPNLRKSIINKLEADTNKTIKNKIIIGCATAYMPYKNPLYLIDVFKQYNHQNSNSILIIAGDGPMKSDVESYAIKNLDSDSYALLGHRSDVADLLQAFDVFVLPSKNEGLPLCILEAQAAGLPCVMSKAITKEAIACKNLVTQVSFKEGPSGWSKAIEKSLHLQNRSSKYADIVDKCGFNLDSPKKILPLIVNE